MNSPDFSLDAVVPRVVDVRLLFDTRSIAVTLSLPMELIEDSASELASLSPIAKLIRMIPFLKDSVLEYKKLQQILTSQGRST